MLAVMVFNLAFASDAGWMSKGAESPLAAAPKIKSCSWTGNKLSISWTAVPRVKNYLVMAKSANQFGCATVRVNTSRLFLDRIPTGSCQDVVTIRPIGRGDPVSISKSACNFR